jgi:glucose-6-phosphate dehydrogenase assembly protein OpcA
MEDAVSASSLARAKSATVVVVGSSARLIEAAGALSGEGDSGAVMVVLIATDSQPAPAVESQPDVISIGGLRPEYVNNAIAGVRLSSLPTVVWWRGGRPEALDGVGTLADRVVLDAEEPGLLWTRLPSLFEQTAFTDLRWTRLTRWRSAMAHFFDLPQVRQAESAFDHLTIGGSDRYQCGLFAGWLDSSLGWNRRIVPRVLSGNAPLESVSLGGGGAELELKLLPGDCLDAQVRLATHTLASRVVSLGDQSLHTLMSEELRVRSRDLAFERAVVSTLATQPS